jgi:hypothetical protein
MTQRKPPGEILRRSQQHQRLPHEVQTVHVPEPDVSYCQRSHPKGDILSLLHDRDENEGMDAYAITLAARSEGRSFHHPHYIKCVADGRIGL